MDSLPPTPVQILRFATTQTSQTTKAYQPLSRLDLNLEQFFSESKPRGLFPSIKAQGDKRDLLVKRLRETQNLRELQTIMTHMCPSTDAAELATIICTSLTKALIRCEKRSEYDAILATMNSLLLWFKKSGVTDLRDFYILGMQYAGLCFSPQALKHYIREYQNAGYGTFTAEEARLLLGTLRKVLLLSSWENPERDTAPMLQAVAGSDSRDGAKQRTSPTLHSCLPWKESGVEACDFVPLYVSLLGHLRDIHTLTEVWSNLTELQYAEPTDSVSQVLNSCLLAFIAAGEPQKAIRAVHDISSDDRILKLVTKPVWRRLLEHDHNGSIGGLISERELDGVFELELQNIEGRLGIKWTGGESGWHVDTGNAAPIPEVVTDESLHAMDEEKLGLESTSRLLAEVKGRGSSKSMADLSVIAGLLHGNEGREIPLGFIRVHRRPMEVAWFPQCSPIEFSGSPTPAGNDMSSPCSLGLVRARLNCKSVPSKSGRSLYLMQLGYLSTREKHAHPGLHNEDNRWHNTGHIVAWDRVEERFVIFFTGTGRGTVPSNTLQPLSVPSYLPYVSATLTVGNRPLGYESRLVSLLEDKMKLDRYWIDVDPGLALKP